MRHDEVLPGRRRQRIEETLKESAVWLAPFVISLVFILCCCGANISSGLCGIAESRLTLASGPKTRTELGAEGKRIFYPYQLGEQITRVVHRNCGERPRWWSLDYWVNPDAQARINVQNVPSFGTKDEISRPFMNPKDTGHVDLAIVQDGLIIDSELAGLNHAEPDQIQALVHLYKSVFCVFARRSTRAIARSAPARAHCPGRPTAAASSPPPGATSKTSTSSRDPCSTGSTSRPPRWGLKTPGPPRLGPL